MFQNLSTRSKVLLLVLGILIVLSSFAPYEWTLNHAESYVEANSRLDFRYSTFELAEEYNKPYEQSNMVAKNDTIYFNLIDPFEDVSLYGDEDKDNTLAIKVYDKTSVSLLRFLPFVKSVSFDSYIEYSAYFFVAENNFNSTVIVNGEVKVEGSRTAYGLESGWKSREFIQEEIMKKAHQAISKDLTEKIKNI